MTNNIPFCLVFENERGDRVVYDARVTEGSLVSIGVLNSRPEVVLEDGGRTYDFTASEKLFFVMAQSLYNKLCPDDQQAVALTDMDARTRYYSLGRLSTELTWGFADDITLYDTFDSSNHTSVGMSVKQAEALVADLQTKIRQVREIEQSLLTALGNERE